jgi:hypothetical protein
MADFFKGLAGGLETGARFGQMLREGEERKRLREAMGLTPQEIAPRPPTQDELGRAQAYTQGIADEDARMFATDDSVERRTGLFSSNPAERPLDASVAPQMPYVGQSVGGTQYRLGDQTLSRMPTQQEIDSARYAAAANVIAERDPVAAMRMRQEQVRMQREAELAPLQKQQLEGSIAGQGLTQKAQQITISEAERKVSQDKANRNAQTLLADISAAGTPIDTATANRIAKETGADMTFVTDAVLKQYNLTKASANDLIERQLTDFNKAAEGGIPTLNKYIAERLDPDKTDNIVPTVVQGADGKLRVMYGNTPLPGYQSYGDLNQLSAAFQGNIKRDPLGAAIQISTLQTQAQARLASEAAVRASDATVGLKNTQMKMFSDQAAGSAEAQQIRAKFTALTPEEQVGPKGQGLMRDFNMANAKAGMAVPLGAAPRAERPALSEADATARAKAIVESKEVGPTGKRLTFMEALDIVRGTPPAPGTPAAARAQIDALLGSGVDPLAPPAAAARPTTGLQTQPAPARDAPVAPNPYVDARGRPLAVAPAGAPSIASTAVPAAVSAVEGAVGTQAAATRYLQAKIARNEPLSPAERARAQQMGLIR